MEFARVMKKIRAASKQDYDMEIVNYLYRDSALVLPHRKYDLISGEFRSSSHERYLGSDVEEWDPSLAYSEAKLVHFSDWPLPKPWFLGPEDIRQMIEPDCKPHPDGAGEDCTARIIWNSLYSDFRKRRQVRLGLSAGYFCVLGIEYTNNTSVGNLYRSIVARFWRTTRQFHFNALKQMEGPTSKIIGRIKDTKGQRFLVSPYPSSSVIHCAGHKSRYMELNALSPPRLSTNLNNHNQRPIRTSSSRS